jgi:hypothetical protein
MGSKSGKILNRPEEMNAVSTEVLVRCFPPVCPFARIIFHLVMSIHVLNPCSACHEHTRGLKGYVTYYFGMLSEVTSAKHAVLYEVRSAKHAWVSLEKIWMGQMGRLEENIAAALLDTLHSFPLACLIFSRNLTPSDSQSYHSQVVTHN